MVWWTVQYLDRRSSDALKTYNSEMIPFGILPHIEEVSIKLGHVFKIKQLLIRSGPVTLHLPTDSIWIEDEDPILVADAKRVILFKKNFHPSEGESYNEVHIGLADVHGRGKKVIISRGTYVVKDHLVTIMPDLDFIPEPEINEC